MNTLKTNPEGVDKRIEQLQKPLYDALNALNPNVKGYGRVFKTTSTEGLKLESISATEYVDVLGGEDSRFFFYLHNDLDGDTNVLAKVDVICMVKLTDFYNTPERMDEEFRTVVTKTIQKSPFKIKKTLLGMDYIQGLVSQNYEKANLRFADIQPFHAVTFQTEVYYNRKT